MWKQTNNHKESLLLDILTDTCTAWLQQAYLLSWYVQTAEQICIIRSP